MAKKEIKITFEVDKIMNVNLSSSKSGYNYASVSIKISDNNYMSVGYEWKTGDDETVPDFVMDLLSFIQKDKANKETASVIPDELKKEGKEFASRLVGFLKECE